MPTFKIHPHKKWAKTFLVTCDGNYQITLHVDNDDYDDVENDIVIKTIVSVLNAHMPETIELLTLQREKRRKVLETNPNDDRGYDKVEEEYWKQYGEFIIK